MPLSSAGSSSFHSYHIRVLLSKFVQEPVVHGSFFIHNKSYYILELNFHIFLSIVISIYTTGIMKGGATHFPPFLHEALVRPRRAIVAATVGLEGAGGGLALPCHIIFSFCAPSFISCPDLLPYFHSPPMLLTSPILTFPGPMFPGILRGYYISKTFDSLTSHLLFILILPWGGHFLCGTTCNTGRILIPTLN